MFYLATFILDIHLVSHILFVFSNANFPFVLFCYLGTCALIFTNKHFENVFSLCTNPKRYQGVKVLSGFWYHFTGMHNSQLKLVQSAQKRNVYNMERIAQPFHNIRIVGPTLLRNHQ